LSARVAGGALVLCSLVVAIVASTGAMATFPGNNGVIVYSLTTGHAKSDIFAIDPSDGERVKLTHNDNDDLQPAASADGKLITYVARLKGSDQVMVMPIDGGAPTQVTNLSRKYVGSPTFSHDGETIVFAVIGRDNVSSNTDIWSVDVTTGQLKILIDKLGGQSAPVFTPDDSRIVFAALGPDGYDVASMRPDGSGVQNLTARYHDDPDAPESLFFDTPDISPDGKHIIASSNFGARPAGTPDIVLMDANGKHLETIVNDRGTDLQPVYSPDGKQICFVRYRNQKAQLVVADADGGQTETVANLAPSGESGYPYWVPAE
jgi:Tol biopolymer transport system component